MKHDVKGPVVTLATAELATGPSPRLKSSWKMLAVACGLFLAALFASAVSTSGAWVGMAGFFLCSWIATRAFLRGAPATTEALRAAGTNAPTKVLAVLGLLLSVGMMIFGVLGTLASFMGGFHRGRQLRRHGRVLLPGIRQGGGWDQQPSAAATLGDLGDLGDALAAQWRENGRTEHASVAAFARLTLDLMGLGAPPALIADANRDALDEIRHTELCFSLARALDGQDLSPSPFPAAQGARTLPKTRTLALAALAVDSLIDGALHEGVSARVIGKLARRCQAPEIRKILSEIAADEFRHAAHGWDVVAWCVAEGGAPVRSALNGALRALPRTMHSPLPDAAADGGWECYGIHGHALEAEEYGRTRTEVVRRVGAMCS